MILGIDEAGRGSAIGELVIAGVCCPEDEIATLKKIGVKDSKLLSPLSRKKLYEIITQQFMTKTIKISPKKIDTTIRSRYSLNLLECDNFIKLIEYFKPKIAYVDCPDPTPSKFKKRILKQLKWKCKLIVEHKADKKFPIVSAASIVAKVERDSSIDKIREKYGDIGSGYPSDKKTIKFIEKWTKNNKKLPNFVRKEWKTFSKLKNYKLTDF